MQYKKSKNIKIEELTKSETSRQYSLSRVMPPKVDGKRYCVWCTEKVLTHGNQKYCSEECSTNMMAWGYPQKEENLSLLLLRQDFKCNVCQFDYGVVVEEMFAKPRIPYGLSSVQETWRTTYSRYMAVRLKDHLHANHSDRRLEVDHIVPIYKGGLALDTENHQAICYTCHKAKSKVDNSGPRKKKLTDSENK